MAGERVARGNNEATLVCKLSVCVFTLIPDKHLSFLVYTEHDCSLF